LEKKMRKMFLSGLAAIAGAMFATAGMADGVVRGERELLKGSFICGGSFARGRVALNMGGHVFQRIGGRTGLELLKSGVFIPVEMVEGQAAKGFDDLVQDVLPRRISYEINRVLVV
jgi:hypothetical protein